jgi:hypothetical protein
MVVIGYPDLNVTKFVDTQPVEELLQERDFLTFTDKAQRLNRDQMLALLGSLFVSIERARRKLQTNEETNTIASRLKYAMQLADMLCSDV